MTRNIERSFCDSWASCSEHGFDVRPLIVQCYLSSQFFIWSKCVLQLWTFAILCLSSGWSALHISMTVGEKWTFHGREGYAIYPTHSANRRVTPACYYNDVIILIMMLMMMTMMMQRLVSRDQSQRWLTSMTQCWPAASSVVWRLDRYTESRSAAWRVLAAVNHSLSTFIRRLPDVRETSSFTLPDYRLMTMIYYCSSYIVIFVSLLAIVTK